MKASSSVNNHIIRRNKCDFYEKNIIRYKIEFKSSNSISKIDNNDRGIKNNICQKKIKNKYEEEDFYKNDIYNKNILKFKFFSDFIDDNGHKYNTLSSFNSFRKRYKDINSFAILKQNNNKRKKRNHNINIDINFLEFHSDLNLTFDNNIKNIFVKKNSKFKLIDKDKNHFMKIIRIFGKNHKMAYYKNNKFIKRKKIIVNGSRLKIKNSCLNNIYISKNKNKFSKKYKKQILKRNKNTDGHNIKSSSQPFVEVNDRRNRSNHNQEIHSKIKEKLLQQKKEEIDISSENNKKLTSKYLFYKYSPITSRSSIKSYETIKVEEESDKIKKNKNTNIFIGLNKKIITENKKENKNHKDNNPFHYNNSNIINSRAYLSYNDKKSNSMFENNYAKEKSSKYKGENHQNNKCEIDQKQQQEPKIIFKRIDNLKQGKKIEAKNKYEIKMNYNRFLYPNDKNTNDKDKNDIIMDNNYYNINNSNININRNNSKEQSLKKISVYTPARKDLNSTYINKRKNIPVNFHEKKDNRVINGFSSNMICLKRRDIETSKTQNEKSIYNSTRAIQNNILSQNKYVNNNLTKSVNNIQGNDLNSTLEKNNQSKIIKRSEEQRNKVIIINNRSYILNNSKTKGREEQLNNRIETNMNNEISKNIKKLSSNSIINEEKSKKTKEIKEIKPEKKNSFSNRCIFNNFQIENKSKNYNNSQPNTYKNNGITSVFVYNKIEQRRKINNSINNINKEKNKYNKNDINKLKGNEVDKNENENIYNNDERHKRSNKFQRSNHKYHEIKSISNDKTENRRGNLKNISIDNSKRNQIVNSTSMDKIKKRNRNNDIHMMNNFSYNKSINDNYKNMGQK